MSIENKCCYPLIDVSTVKTFIFATIFQRQIGTHRKDDKRRDEKRGKINQIMDFQMPSGSMFDTSTLTFSTQHPNDDRSVDEHQVPDEMATETKYTPHLSTSTDAVNSSMEVDDKSFNTLLFPPPSQPPQKRKCILDYFSWLNDVTRTNQNFLGSMVELKSEEILEGMDFLIGKLAEDYHEYYKSPKLAVALARYVRQFLYVYRYLYQSFELVC